MPEAIKSAIVSTVRNAEIVLASFVRYHLQIGFDHIFLFFDDPDDASIPEFENMAHVSAIPVDDALKKEWAGVYHRVNPTVYRYASREVMSRQILNLALCIDRARELDIDWLLHLDSDELFYSPQVHVAEHFAYLEEKEYAQCIYHNFEGIPEQLDIDDFFRVVTLFKRNRALWKDDVSSAQLKHLYEAVPQIPESFFHYYGNGKSAGRLSQSIKPDGVHRFLSGGKNLDHLSASYPVILHYPCCGLGHFRRKYQTLGAITNKWFDQLDIRSSIGHTHLDSRDVIKTSDDELIETFYVNRFMIHDPQLTTELLKTPMFCRVLEPSRFLNELLTNKKMEFPAK